MGASPFVAGLRGSAIWVGLPNAKSESRLKFVRLGENRFSVSSDRSINLIPAMDVKSRTGLLVISSSLGDDMTTSSSGKMAEK